MLYLGYGKTKTSLCEGYRGEDRYVEGTLGEYSIMKEPKEERPHPFVG